MRTLKLIILSLLILVSDFAHSQSVDEIRRIKTVALEVFDNYVATISLLYQNESYEEDRFFDLFSSEAKVYNDIIPDSTSLGKMIAPFEYYSVLNKTVKNYKTEFRRLRLSFPTEEGEKWIINCSFDQTFYYINGKNNLKYPEWRLNKVIRISMDKRRTGASYGNAKIEKVDIDRENGGEVLSDYFIVQNVDSLILRIKTLSLSKDDYEGKLLPSPRYKPQDINIPSLNYFQSLISENKQSDSRFYRYHLVNRDLFSASLKIAPVAKGFNIDNALLPDVNQSAFALGGKAGYGFQISRIKKSTLFLNLGLDIDFYKNKLDGQWNTSYSDVDSDGDRYLRKISISSYKENTSVLSLNVPIALECLISLEKAQKPMFITVEGGFYAGYRLAISQSFSFDAKYTGVYDYFGGVEFDHYYDYGDFKMSDSNVDYSLQAKKFDFGILLNVGVVRELAKDKLIKITLGYQQGFQALSDQASDYCLTKNNKHYISPIETATKGLTNFNIGVSFVKILK